MQSRNRSGFTLIELLVVIAIIALLAAIIFPVVNSAKTNVKKTSCMNNLANIAQALKMYKLDEGRYPAELFPYDPLANPSNDANKRGMKDAVGPLYPNYVKSFEIFHCPMDWPHDEAYYRGEEGGDPDQAGGPNNDAYCFYYLDESVDPPVERRAYKYDSYSFGYDVVDNYTNGEWLVNHADYERRYMLKREPMGNFPPGSPHYKRQLIFRNPPADTVVTWCSWHRDYSAKNGDIWTVKKGSIDIVLFLDGSARPVNTEKVLLGAEDSDHHFHYGFVEP
jgi:prepilin-type N-terminal cleavage/methylation domain-containing protein